MGAGYTRQSEANIVDEAVINADDFNAEFDQIESAFNATTGHTHDGTEGEGPKIDTAGLADGAVTTAKIDDDAVTGAKIDSTTTITAASFVGPFTGNVTGNCDTATALQTARTIAGQSFDGTANISIAPGDLTGVTATAAELNKLEGATITTTELNYLDGVTSNIQDQIDGLGGGGGGTGDVVGPSSATDNYVALFDGTTGKVIQDSSNQDGFIQGIRIGKGNGGISTNTAFGLSALDSVTSGNQNTALGYATGNDITSGASNTIVGYGAGSQLTTGNQNVIIGDAAGSSITNDDGNTFVGYAAGTTAGGDENTAVGSLALSSLTNGTINVAMGWQTGSSMTTGSINALLGARAGENITEGENNVAVGYFSGNESALFNITTQNNKITMGNTDHDAAYIAVAWTVPSDARDKTDFEDLNVGLNFINRVEPKTFRYDHRTAYYVYDENNEIISKPTPDGTHKTDRKFLGFSAQQVQEAVEDSGLPDQIIIDSSDPDHYKMKETAFIPVLVKAVQELSARVEQLEAQLNNT